MQSQRQTYEEEVLIDDSSPPRRDRTIEGVADATVAARFLADMLDLQRGRPTGLFVPVRTGNGVTLDCMTTETVASVRRLAFAVTEEQFGTSLTRVVAQDVTYCAGPRASARPDQRCARGPRALHPRPRWIQHRDPDHRRRVRRAGGAGRAATADAPTLRTLKRTP